VQLGIYEVWVPVAVINELRISKGSIGGRPFEATIQLADGISLTGTVPDNVVLSGLTSVGKWTLNLRSLRELRFLDAGKTTFKALLPGKYSATLSTKSKAGDVLLDNAGFFHHELRNRTNWSCNVTDYVDGSVGKADVNLDLGKINKIISLEDSKDLILAARI
jgi:hypothetical protein